MPWGQLSLLEPYGKMPLHNIQYSTKAHNIKTEHRNDSVTRHLTWVYWRKKDLIYLPSSSGPRTAPCSHHSRLSLFPWWSECHQPAQHQKGPHNLQRWWAAGGKRKESQMKGREKVKQRYEFHLAALLSTTMVMVSGELHDRWLLWPETGPSDIHWGRSGNKGRNT